MAVGETESLFGAKPVSEIRNMELYTRKRIESMNEELRQLIDNRYRDLIDSADSILSMKSSCQSICSGISSISDSLSSLKSSASPNVSPNPDRIRSNCYCFTTRVKYIVDTPEKIWECFNEFMFFEASARYVSAKLVYQGLSSDLKKNFPVLDHQWRIVESLKGQISQRSRERLMMLDDKEKLPIGAFADALAALAIIHEHNPKKSFCLLLDSRKSLISQKLRNDNGSVAPLLCEVTRTIQVTIAHVGEMFLQVLNDMPLFYKKVIVESQSAALHLFGGILNPDEEVRLWNENRNKLLESMMMTLLDRTYIAKACSGWLKEFEREIVKKIDAISSGAELASAEKLIRETMGSKDVLDQGSLEWLKSVFGLKAEFPWSRTRELVLEESVDLWEEIFEDAFVSRMKEIIDTGFKDMIKAVNISESIRAIGSNFDDKALNFKKSGVTSGMKAALMKDYNDFDSYLNVYLGPEVSQIRDIVDGCCRSVLEDLLHLLESPKAALRMTDLAPYLQNKCYESICAILTDISAELDKLRATLDNESKGGKFRSPAAIIESSLYIGRLLFAFQNHLKHTSVVFGSPRVWVSETVASGSEVLPFLSSYSTTFSLKYSSAPDDSQKPMLNNSMRDMSHVATALFGANDSKCSKLEQLKSSMRDLSIAAHCFWISWVVDDLVNTLLEDLRADNALSATNPRQGWEEVFVKQDQSSESESEMKILLPSMPSFYICSYLFKACEEVHHKGGHFLDKTILQRFAKRLLEKVIEIYGDLISSGVQMSEKGILQVVLDLRFAGDVLSGCDSTVDGGLSDSLSRRKQDGTTTKSATRERIVDLINCFSQRLDPIDWQVFEPYLWEKERQAYLRHAVLFGFFVQLNRLYTDTVWNPQTNLSVSNIMRCSTNIPHFKLYDKYELSSRIFTKQPIRTPGDGDVSLMSSQKGYTKKEFSQRPNLDHHNSSSQVAAPCFKSSDSQTLKSIRSTPKYLTDSTFTGILM